MALMNEVRAMIKEEKRGSNVYIRVQQWRVSRSKSRCMGPNAEDVDDSLIAIMLGRLNMKDLDCLQSFEKYANEIFSHPKRLYRASAGLILPKYGTNRLNKATQAVVGNFDPSPESLKWKSNLFNAPGNKCKCGVLAYGLREDIGVERSRILRSYRPSIDVGEFQNLPEKDCQIWEIARATCAAPLFFPRITIGHECFLDGGFGTNNPSMEALKELQGLTKKITRMEALAKHLLSSVGPGSGERSLRMGSVFPIFGSNIMSATTTSRIGIQGPPKDITKYLFISVGSGSGERSVKTGSILPLFGKRLVSAAKALLTDTQSVHKDMAVISERQNITYFRFNVEHGLDELSLDRWIVKKNRGTKEFSTRDYIKKVTEEYLNRPDVQRQIRQCARVLVSRRHRHSEANSSVQLPPAVSMIPISRNRDFTGREEVLDSIDRVLRDENRIALIGLGGCGKTQIAVEFAYRYHDRHPDRWIFWVEMYDFAAFEASVRSIANVTRISGREEKGANVFRLVHDWLQDKITDEWLMIIDNDEYPSTEDSRASKWSVSLQDFLPETVQSRILVTSRQPRPASTLTGKRKNIFEIGPMSKHDATQLFRDLYRRECNDLQVNNLLERINYLPLAIVQCASFMRRRECSLNEYVAMFDQRTKELRGELPLLDPNTEERLASPSMFLNKIDELQDSAIDLLSLISFFQPDSIPTYLLSDYKDPHGVRNNADDLDFDEDIRRLQNTALVRINKNGDMCSIHRLLQFAVRQRLKTYNTFEIWKQKYLVILAAAYPENFTLEWAKCTELYKHAEEALSHKPADVEYFPVWTTIIMRAARFAIVTGELKAAERLAVATAEESARVLGPKNPRAIACIRLLEEIWLRQGNLLEENEYTTPLRISRGSLPISLRESPSASRLTDRQTF
ncbi:hypothetical protein ACLMJK_006999 [Lecanora helva]